MRNIIVYDAFLSRVSGGIVAYLFYSVYILR